MKSIRALLQFTTILPLGSPVDFDLFARNTYLYPVAGYITGAIAAAVCLLIIQPQLAAAAAIAVLLLVSGCNHLDGLLDFGDGLMAHGSPEKRLSAMTDRNTGSGALAMGMATIIATFAAISSITPDIWLWVLIAEVMAALSLSFMTVMGKPVREGIHSYLHKSAKKRFLFYSTVLTLPLAWAAVTCAGVPVMVMVVVYAVTLVTQMIMLGLAFRIFGGVNGDIAGATHEIVRCAVLFAVALMI